MASFEERIYQLGADALAEQERHVAELRGRASTLLAAGAVIASLLAEPVFHDVHPVGLAEVASASVGLIGAGGVLVFVGLLLWPRHVAVNLNPSATYRALWREGVVAQPAVDLSLAEYLRSAAHATPRSCSDWSLALL